MFSNGGLNTLTPQLFSTAADLRAMPWRLVYHVGAFDRARDRSILHHRQAEVVVPSALDLESLQWIVCRSQAEKDTLMYLLTPALRDRYQRRILASGRLSLHYRQHTYVDRAVLSRESILLSFSPDTKSPGPFAAEYTITICGRERQVARTLQANSDVELRFGEPMSSYEVMLRLDGHIAYAGSYTDSDMVF